MMQIPRRCFPHLDRWHNRLAFQLLDIDLMAIHSDDMGSDLDIFEAWNQCERSTVYLRLRNSPSRCFDMSLPTSGDGYRAP
jgi:hypothetical protein